MARGGQGHIIHKSKLLLLCVLSGICYYIHIGRDIKKPQIFYFERDVVNLVSSLKINIKHSSTHFVVNFFSILITELEHEEHIKGFLKC